MNRVWNISFFLCFIISVNLAADNVIMDSKEAVEIDNITQSKTQNLKNKISSLVKNKKFLTCVALGITAVVGGFLFKNFYYRKNKKVASPLRILYGESTKEKSGSPLREIEDKLSIQTSKVGNYEIITFCVCDGTGGPGVASFVANNIHDKLKNKFLNNNDNEIISSIKNEFKTLDFEIRDKLLDGVISDGQLTHIPEEDGRTFYKLSPPKPATKGDIVSGSTATLGIIVQKPDGNADFWSCNIGDSKTILTKHKDNQEKVVFSSNEHTLLDEGEAQRMEAFKNPYDSKITYKYDDGRRSNVTTSRLLGIWRHKSDEDENYEQSAVLAIPDIKKVPLDHDHSLLILTSDGLLHTLKAEDIVKFINENVNHETLSQQQTNQTLSKSLILDKCAKNLIDATHNRETNDKKYHDDKAIIIAKLSKNT